MTHARKLLLASLVISNVLLVGCGSSGGGSGATVTPSIAIASPLAGAVITGTADDPDVPLTFTVENFTLMPAHACNGAKNCGHIHILVDGTKCNDPGDATTTPPTVAAPYNGAIYSLDSPAAAGLDYCESGGGTIAGAHTITLELHDENHAPIDDPATGKVISASVAITAS